MTILGASRLAVAIYPLDVAKTVLSTAPSWHSAHPRRCNLAERHDLLRHHVNLRQQDAGRAARQHHPQQR